MTPTGILPQISQEQFIAVMYSIFGDESADANKNFFGVAALFGSKQDWAAAESQWIARIGGKVFHAADCESGKQEFAANSREQNLGLYKDLVKIISNSNLMGYGSAIDIREFRSIFPKSVKDQPYYFCFADVVVKCMENAVMCIPRGELEIIFDRNAHIEFNAGLLYDSIAHRPEWKDIPYIPDKISFATRKTVGIQIADLVARETMKHMSNTLGAVKRHRRLSMDALVKSQRFRFLFYTNESLLDMKNKLEQFGIPEHRDFWIAYKEWLKKCRIGDNMSARLRYLKEREG